MFVTLPMGALALRTLSADIVTTKVGKLLYCVCRQGTLHTYSSSQVGCVTGECSSMASTNPWLMCDAVLDDTSGRVRP